MEAFSSEFGRDSRGSDRTLVVQVGEHVSLHDTLLRT